MEDDPIQYTQSPNSKEHLKLGNLETTNLVVEFKLGWGVSYKEKVSNKGRPNKPSSKGKHIQKPKSKPVKQIGKEVDPEGVGPKHGTWKRSTGRTLSPNMGTSLETESSLKRRTKILMNEITNLVPREKKLKVDEEFENPRVMA